MALSSQFKSICHASLLVPGAAAWWIRCSVCSGFVALFNFMKVQRHTYYRTALIRLWKSENPRFDIQLLRWLSGKDTFCVSLRTDLKSMQRWKRNSDSWKLSFSLQTCTHTQKQGIHSKLFTQEWLSYTTVTELQAHRCKANSILGFWQMNLAKWPWETQMHWHQRMELKHAVCQSRESSTLHSHCAAFRQSVKSRNTADAETVNRDVKKQGRVHLRPCRRVTKRGEASHAPCQRRKGGGLVGRELGHFYVTSASYLTAAENKENAFSTVMPCLMMCWQSLFSLFSQYDVARSRRPKRQKH